MMISIKGYVMSKTLVNDPTGGKMIMIQIVEERETPGPVVTGTDETSQMMRDVMPLVQQFLRSMPILAPFMSGKVPIPRLVIWLNEDEAEALGPKIDVGDVVEIRIENGKMELVKL